MGGVNALASGRTKKRKKKKKRKAGPAFIFSDNMRMNSYGLTQYKGSSQYVSVLHHQHRCSGSGDSSPLKYGRRGCDCRGDEKCWSLWILHSSIRLDSK